MKICTNVVTLLPSSKEFNLFDTRNFIILIICLLGYKESNEELQAALVSKSLEEGRTLLNDTQDKSLAAEFDAMSENEVENSYIKKDTRIIISAWTQLCDIIKLNRTPLSVTHINQSLQN